MLRGHLVLPGLRDLLGRLVLLVPLEQALLFLVVTPLTVILLRRTQRAILAMVTLLMVTCMCGMLLIPSGIM